VAPRVTGRPLGADEAKVKEVLKLRKDGLSLRAIVAAAGITLRTVRTIVEKDAGTDRATKRTNLLRKQEFDRLRAADYRARQKAQKQLQKSITATQKHGAELLKAAKGLGR